MTPLQIIKAHVRQYRSIPKGAIFWLNHEKADDFIGVDETGRSLDLWLKSQGHPACVEIILDCPDDDFDRWLIDAKELLTAPKISPKIPKQVEARESAIASYGSKKITCAETIINLYAEYLLSKYRKDFGYIGKTPVVRINWNSKHSWGGNRGFTISPSYLYSPSGYFGFCFNEYQHIAEREDIGKFLSFNRHDHLKALVAHELAHFLQRHTSLSCFRAASCSLPQLNYRTAHGEGWQYIYAYLREPLNARLRG